MSEWQKYRDEMLAADPELRREYDRLGPQYQIVMDVIRLRRLRGLTQEQLATKMGRQQPAIARLEGASVLPSISFLQDLAEALDARLTVRIEPLEDVPEDAKARPLQRSVGRGRRPAGKRRRLVADAAGASESKVE